MLIFIQNKWSSIPILVFDTINKYICFYFDISYMIIGLYFFVNFQIEKKNWVGIPIKWSWILTFCTFAFTSTFSTWFVRFASTEK